MSEMSFADFNPIRLVESREEYEIAYTISGKMKVMASSKAEAELRFWQFDQAELGENGTLESIEPERVRK